MKPAILLLSGGSLVGENGMFLGSFSALAARALRGIAVPKAVWALAAARVPGQDFEWRAGTSLAALAQHRCDGMHGQWRLEWDEGAIWV